MFTTSFLLLCKAILINLFVPMLIGILFIWLVFGTYFRGITLYITSFFLGTGVVAYSLFNLQFFHFGIGFIEYIGLCGIILSCFLLRILLKKEKFREYITTLYLTLYWGEIVHSWRQCTFSKKLVSVWGMVVIGTFVILSFLFVSLFPTYSDDSFGNWNNPAINIFYDGGVKIFGEQNEILGRGRLGYPIIIPIYKALISDIFGEFNDIYINLWQYIGFIFFLVFVFHITFQKTKDLFFSLVPLILITGLPLIFFHSVESYLDLSCALYSFFVIYFFAIFLSTGGVQNILFGLLFGCILTNIKNDGMIVYFFGILISFLAVVIFRKQMKELFLAIRSQIWNIIFLGLCGIWFLIPTLFLRQYYGFGYNQAAGETSGVGISQSIHTEIFSVFPEIFFHADNYNLALIFIGLLFLFVKRYKKIPNSILFILLSPILIFCILICVFLFTENYLWVMNQTTVNRVFTMVFVILFSFSGLLLYDKNDLKDSLL